MRIISKKKSLESILGVFTKVQTDLEDFLHDSASDISNINEEIESLKTKREGIRSEYTHAEVVLDKIQSLVGGAR